MSWNREITPTNYKYDMSTSSWGRELKWQDARALLSSPCRSPREVVSWNDHTWPGVTKWVQVDLLARSWVEICSYVHTECVWRVDILVRSWVEILFQHYYHFYGYGRPFCEVVSWNDEYCAKMNEASGRPLREVVSWNVIVWRCTSIFCVSTSLWGRELK